MISLEEYFSDIPNLHSWDEGKTWNTGGFDRWCFEPLHEVISAHLPANARFIETGAGNSTIFFLLHAPKQVVSIAPDSDLFARIRSYCTKHGISDAPLTAHIAGSQWTLPALAEKGQSQFDFGLIDGLHGMTMVFLDFHYINALIREGGLIMIDDVQLYPVAELANLLREQWGYEEVLDRGKYIVFRKTTDERELPDFGGQPYVMRRGREAQAGGEAQAGREAQNGVSRKRSSLLKYWK